ncbi:hypothetical protein HG530_011771 [Fusarium avenaceum]|nr:hypothetical protein HG530_011771 [Fusarium avenaceum]
MVIASITTIELSFTEVSIATSKVNLSEVGLLALVVVMRQAIASEIAGEVVLGRPVSLVHEIGSQVLDLGSLEERMVFHSWYINKDITIFILKRVDLMKGEEGIFRLILGDHAAFYRVDDVEQGLPV